MNWTLRRKPPNAARPRTIARTIQTVFTNLLLSIAERPTRADRPAEKWPDDIRIETAGGQRHEPGAHRVEAGQLLGPIGTIAVGVVLLTLIVAWAVRSITRRPKRTVWLPAQS